MTPLPDGNLGATIPETAPASVVFLSRISRMLTTVALIGCVGSLVVGLSAQISLKKTRDALRGHPRHYSLPECALRLERAVEHGWWVRFYPGYPARAARVAAQIREGNMRLLLAAAAYDSCSALVNGLELPGRLLRSRPMLAALEEALARVPDAMGRTLPFREMSEGLQPYLALDREGSMSVSGNLIAAPTGHGLLFALLDPEGTVRWDSSLPARVGDRFSIPLRPQRMTLRLTDFEFSPENRAARVVEDMELPVDHWGEGEILFPASHSTFRIRFSEQSVASAPPLPPLSEAARRELMPTSEPGPPLGDR